MDVWNGHYQDTGNALMGHFFFLLQVPERADQFHVDLTEIISGSHARINSQARSAVVNVLDSDFPNGTIAFSKDSM